MNTTNTATLQPNQTMEQILTAYPGAKRALFRAYHIGGCGSCGFQPQETLAELCARKGGLNPEEVIDCIQKHHQEDLTMMIEPKELKRLMDEGVAMKLIDMRSNEEHEAVSIQNSILLTRESMSELMNNPEKDMLVVLYDHQGQHVLDAGTYFAGHGFTNVRCLKGGIDEWAAQVDSNMPRYDLEDHHCQGGGCC